MTWASTNSYKILSQIMNFALLFSYSDMEFLDLIGEWVDFCAVGWEIGFSDVLYEFWYLFLTYTDR